MPSRCAIFATSVSADDRAEDPRGSKCRLSEEMRCFRHSPYRGADERLLRCFGHQRELSESTSRIYKPYKNFGHRRNSITLSSRLDNLHNRSSSCSSTTLTTTHQNPPSNTQTPFQQCRAVNPRRPRSSRLRADARKSRSIIRSSHHPHRLR
jgi:hypothetical protein